MSWLSEARDNGRMDNWITQMEAKGWTRAGRNWLDMAGGDKEFAVWLVLADVKVSRFAGIGLFDLGDSNTRDAFDSGYTPGEGAREALENDDTYGSFMAGME